MPAQRAEARREVIDSDQQPSARSRLAPPRDQQVDLAVVLVHAGVLERIEDGLLDVVQVATAPIRREGVHAQGDPSARRRLAGPAAAQEGTDVPAERPALPADQRAVPDVPPVVVDARRIWQVEHQPSLPPRVLVGPFGRRELVQQDDQRPP